MELEVDMHAMDTEVQRIKSAVEKLSRMGENFPAITRNAVRILASVKMLELNISDYVSLESAEQ